jgi:phosphoribosylaminoimidazole (AIR) synthetase
MRRVFNMGVGMIVISPEALPESESLIRVGQVVAGQTPVILY